MEGKSPIQFDDLLKYSVGDFGLFQFLMVVYLFLPDILQNGQVLGTVFYAAKAEDFWCESWPHENCSQWNMTTNECMEYKRDVSVPVVYDKEANKSSYDECSKYNYSTTTFNPFWDFENKRPDVIPCDEGWVYNQTEGYTTLVTEFNLVCEQDSYADLAQSVIFAGYLVGSLVFGGASDKYGRRLPLAVALLLFGVCGSLAAFSTNFWMFFALRFVVGVAGIGRTMCAFTFWPEIVGTSKRALVGNCVWVFNTLGYCVTAGLCYFITDWRWVILATSAPVLLLLLLMPIIPESPRWLLSQGKVEKAEKVIHKMASVNGKTASSESLQNLVIEITEDNEEPDETKASFKDVFRSKKLCLRLAVLMFQWAVLSLVYYGIALFSADLGLNVYLTFIILGLVEFPSYMLCIILMDCIGRKPTAFVCFLVGGAATILIAFLSPGIVTTIIAVIGKFGITAAFGTFYVYTTEVFPTPIRSSGLGCCSCASRIGGILAPLVIYLDNIVNYPISMIIFGVSALLSALLIIFLPETLNKPLPDTIKEAEDLSRSPTVSTNNALRSGVVST